MQPTFYKMERFCRAILLSLFGGELFILAVNGLLQKIHLIWGPSTLMSFRFRLQHKESGFNLLGVHLILNELSLTCVDHRLE